MVEALRLPLDIFDDARLSHAAAYACVAPPHAVAIWIAALIVAARHGGEAPANYSFAVATAHLFDEPIGPTERLIQAFRRFGLIHEGRIADWARYEGGVGLRPAHAQGEG